MTVCPVCATDVFERVLSLPQMPALVNAQVRPDAAPHVRRGDIELVVCLGCGHLYNAAFDSTILDYDAAYENTLHFSAEFQKFAASLVDDLVQRHDLVGARVGELGSGPGHFLSMLCEAGVGEGLGWDPSYDPGRLGTPEHAGVTISTDMFPDDGSVPMRFAFSQHVLEHLADPVSALRAQGAAVVATGGVVYSEVPNGQLMVEHVALWDLIYEHYSYFVPTSLVLACRLAGLAPTAVGVAFGDQFLWCEAKPASRAVETSADREAVEAAVRSALAFGAAARERIAEARRDLECWAGVGPVAVWGAGSKGCTFLNVVAADAAVACVVDINPRKAGWGVPGTSLTIQQPESLRSIQPNTVLVANPIYVHEIKAQLADLGVRADVRPLWE